MRYYDHKIIHFGGNLKIGVITPFSEKNFVPLGTVDFIEMNT